MALPYRSYIVGSICTCALLMVVSAFLYKTTRTSETGIWTESFGLWSIAAIACGVIVLWEMLSSYSSGRYAAHSVVTAIMFAIPFAVAGLHRLDLERTFEEQRTYTNQELAVGLYVVPWAALAGIFSSALLMIVVYSGWAMKQRRWPVTGPPASGGFG